jgi:hypothetical protein
MGFGGWQACWPLQWGGGPTLIESALDALRAGVGKGHAAEADGIDWRWREARAIGIAIGMAMADRMLSQFDATLATTGIRFYQELYFLEGYNDQQVRELAHQYDLATDDYGENDIRAVLQQIDARFEFITRPFDEASTTVAGRTFGDWAGNAPFNLPGGRNDTSYPNVSNMMTLEVVLPTDGEAPTADELVSVDRASAVLDETLPAWVDYNFGDADGFILDISLLDWSRFND